MEDIIYYVGIDVATSWYWL